MLIAAADDPLHDDTHDAAPLLARGRFLSLPPYADPGFAAARFAAVINFLNRSA